LKLSRERAASVVKALEARGVNGANLKSVGVGSKEATVPATASDAERQVTEKLK
jgi:outer membrane protein OmpA-like peptidoglycan-associated protein